MTIVVIPLYSSRAVGIPSALNMFQSFQHCHGLGLVAIVSFPQLPCEMQPLRIQRNVTLSGLTERDRTASCAALLSGVCQGSSIFPGLNYLNQSYDMFFNHHKLETMVQSIPQISSKCYRNLRRKNRWNHFLLFRGCFRLGKGITILCLKSIFHRYM